MEFSTSKSLDIMSLRWGYPPAPLLPRILRQAWRGHILPNWVCTATGLSLVSTMEMLGPNVWESMKQLTPRLEHFLLFQLRSHFSTVKALKCFDRGWPLGLKLGDISWMPRTRNALAKEGLLTEESELVKLTFHDLFEIKGMGAKSILDFLATLEAAMDSYDQLVSSYLASKIDEDDIAITSVIRRPTLL